jgi:hypothetical protein
VRYFEYDLALREAVGHESTSRIGELRGYLPADDPDERAGHRAVATFNENPAV